MIPIRASVVAAGLLLVACSSPTESVPPGMSPGAASTSEASTPGAGTPGAGIPGASTPEASEDWLLGTPAADDLQPESDLSLLDAGGPSDSAPAFDGGSAARAHSGPDAAVREGTGVVDPFDGLDLPEDGPLVAPCSLIDLALWEELSGSPSETVDLEYGEACGFLPVDGFTRLAVGVVDGAPLSVWGVREDTEEVPVVGADTAYWLPSVPDPQSGTLVVVTASAGVPLHFVLEIAHRGGTLTFDELRDLLARVAADALPRVASALEG